MFDIHLERKRHEYTLNAVAVPGVTKILRAAMKFAGAKAADIAAATERGTDTHLAVHLDARGILDPETISTTVSPYFDAWRRFVRESQFKPALSEYLVGSVRYGFCGELDLVGRLPHTPPRAVDLIDVKTCAGMPITVGPQTAAYAQGLQETMRAANIAGAPLDIRRHCLHLRRDRTYRLVAQNNANDWPVFSSALIMWRWCNEHGLND